ncbi:hypothetical protein ACTQ49_02105 [Luteococcus sp. Sow4_B9]|uniref:hypothetical protein n=1 Tax=Luteococcus sp. Sow4_B9 TaxID=3438792 RepID=UPI003F9BE87A
MVAEAPAPGQLTEHPDLARLRARPRSVLADAVAVVLDPTMTLFAGLVVTILHAMWPHALAGLGWVALAALFVVVSPLAVLEVCVRRGWVSDLQVVRREERVKPLLLVIAMVLLGLGVLVVLSAPRVLLAFVGAVLVGLTAMTAISVKYKASFHAGVLAAMGAVVAVEVGWWTVGVSLPLLGLLAWARWRAGRHSTGQVLVGALLCSVLVGGSFALLH